MFATAARDGALADLSHIVLDLEAGRRAELLRKLFQGHLAGENLLREIPARRRLRLMVLQSRGGISIGGFPFQWRMRHVEADICLIVYRDGPGKLRVPDLLPLIAFGARALPELEGIGHEEIGRSAQPHRLLVLAFAWKADELHAIRRLFDPPAP